MKTLSDPTPSVSSSVVPPTVVAALLLLARSFLERLDLPRPSVAAILRATQASRSRAYELKEVLAAPLPGVVQPVGRPKKAAPTPLPDPAAELTGQVLRYLYAHPGAATHAGDRRFYSEGFRRRILELQASTVLDREAFARAVHVPLGTLEGWLRTNEPSDEDEACPVEPSLPEEAHLHIQTIIAAWRVWRGNFADFILHLKDNLRVPHGRSFVARVLFAFNERIPRRRAGRSPDEDALRGSFEVFFPDAQWVGDGMQVPVVINGERHDFNLEFLVDTYSGAIVGASIRDEEDTPAVIEAFEDGVLTTGAAPLAVLLDNRSSNHTAEVDEALGETLRMRSTLGRPQNKAHVEGGFGLFSQHAPPIDVVAHSVRGLARELLRLRVQTFARTLNQRPRRDRSGHSRIDIHRSKIPTEDEVAAARAALEEQRRKRERATENDLQRADPVTRRFLDDAFERLGILDPDHHAQSALARYGRDIVLEAVAIFEGKARANTLPDEVDAARYLLGIAKNLRHIHEADDITQALLRNRVAARDALLADLEAERQVLLADEHRMPSLELLHALIDRALGANRTIDQLFWLDAAGHFLSQQPTEDHQPLFRDLARRIHTTFALRPRERATIERRLARIVWPVN